MGDFLAELLKSFSEPGRKPLVALILVVAGVMTGIGCVLVYERYTASFRLSRLQREAELLTRLAESQIQSTNSSPDVVSARKALLSQVSNVINESPITLEFVPSRLTFSMESLWKFLAGGAFWWAFSIPLLRKFKTEEARRQILGTLVLGGVAGFIGVFLPPIIWPWFHILIYPWILVAALGLATVPLIVAVSLKSAKARAQQINCVNNLKQVGLAAKQWALNHEDVFPRDFTAIKGELGTDRTTYCPASPAVQYEIISPGATDTDPSLVYARCPIHGIDLLADGSVQGLKSTGLKAQFDSARSLAQANACINNLRQIDGALQQWALEKGRDSDATPTKDDLDKYFKGGKLPQCPGGGSYRWGKVRESPTCSNPNHSLPS